MAILRLMIALLFMCTVFGRPSLKGLEPTLERLCELSPKITQNLVSLYEDYLLRVQDTFQDVQHKHLGKVGDVWEVDELWALLQNENPELTKHQEELKKMKLSLACEKWLGISYSGEDAYFTGGIFGFFLKLLPSRRFDLLNSGTSGVIRAMIDLRMMNYQQVYLGEAKDEELADIYLNYLTLFSNLNSSLYGWIIHRAHDTGVFGLYQQYSSVSAYTLNLELMSGNLGLLSSYINHERDTITNTMNGKWYLSKNSKYKFAYKLWKVMQVMDFEIRRYLSGSFKESVEKLKVLTTKKTKGLPYHLEIRKLWELCIAFDFLNSIALEEELYVNELAQIRKMLTEKAINVRLSLHI